jgi:hypothetical protein
VSGQYTGPTPLDGFGQNPYFPVLPSFPTETNFPLAGNINITSSQTIPPGSYGSVNFLSGQTLTLNGPGVYIFNSMNLGGNCTLNYDFQNQPTGNFKIYIHGDALLSTLNTQLLNGGVSNRIYWEVHGTGSSSPSLTESFIWGTGFSVTPINFFGTVMANNAALTIAHGALTPPYYLNGALFSRTRVQVDEGITIDYTPYIDCSSVVADAGPDYTICPGENSISQLGTAPVASISYSWSPTIGLSNSTISYPTVNNSLLTETTIYTLTATSGLCTMTDQVVINVLTPPTITGDFNLCQGETSLLIGSDTAHSEGPWFSSVPEVATINDTGLVTGIIPGTTIITYVNNNNCIDTATVNVFALPNADAGSDTTLTCSNPTAFLVGYFTANNPYLQWETEDSTIISGQLINVSSPGKYCFKVYDNNTGCEARDTVHVFKDTCVFPYFPPPTDGKNYDLIGPELSQLYSYPQNIDSIGNIFRLSGDSVYIEVIINKMKEDSARIILQLLGMTDSIYNGDSSLIFSGKFPRNNLQMLNQYPLLFNYVRPVYLPVLSRGVAYTRGDIAQHSDIGRSSFGLDGNGVKVGVLSDSYNKVAGNPAHTDIVNGDLPGQGNIDGDTIPVQILKDYPYGTRTDEGRAMLQIIHDVAPKATLAFRTGFLSAENFALGIKELEAAGCDVICDDITYLTEPFFYDGVVSKAVNDVTALGVSYFTAAGNFGTQSYEAVFAPAPAPDGIVGLAHDFGNGDIFQNITLIPGEYTLVLQWEDLFYSQPGFCKWCY